MGFFGLVILVNATLTSYVTAKAGGKVIPGFNPLKWLVVAEHPASFRVSGYHLLRGPAPAVEFAKLDGVSREEAGKLMAVPDVKRMHYHSYIVTVTRNGGSVVFSDPLRGTGLSVVSALFQKFHCINCASVNAISRVFIAVCRPLCRRS